jgi:membrane-associated phospholipid phosphatase
MEWIRNLIAAIACACSLPGCGTMANGRGWGQDATLAPGWRRVGQAALDAAAAPQTWVPVVGALAFQIGHADRNLADWAARETPVFRSQPNANRMSDDLRTVSGAIWFASALAAPSGDGAGDWWIAKAKGFAVQAGEGAFMRQTVGFLKKSVDRTRPNGHAWSFPSLHATATSSNATLASRNIETLQWPSAATTASQLGLGGLTALTAWSRLEAHQHYPSDVLAGIAIGHFLGAFFSDAFMGLDGNVRVVAEASRKTAFAGIRFSF